MICHARLTAGGIETACITQINEFSRRGYKIYVLAENGFYAEKLKQIKGVTYINFPYESRASYNLQKVEQVKEIIEKYNIKLVYIHQIDCVASVLSACILTNIPYIAYVHHGITGVYDDELQMGNMGRNFQTLYYKMASKIIAIQEASKKENMERFKLEENKYKVIPNCVDFLEFNSKSPINLNKVLLISRFEKDKKNGVINGLRWFLEYKKLNSKAELTIVGDGSQRQKVEEQIKELKIECHMLGARNDIRDIMEQNGIILGIARCAQEAIAMKRIAIITGNEDFQGIITNDNIEKFSYTNFQDIKNGKKEYAEVAKQVYLLKNKDIGKIVDKNYEWLYTNRNIKDNIYEVEDIEKINNPITELDRNEILRILIGELQYMHTWMQKEIDRGWEARQKTEDYYLGREKWNNKVLKEKEQELEQYIAKYNNALNELENIKSGKFWKIYKKLFKNNKNKI